MSSCHGQDTRWRHPGKREGTLESLGLLLATVGCYRLPFGMLRELQWGLVPDRFQGSSAARHAASAQRDALPFGGTGSEDDPW